MRAADTKADNLCLDARPTSVFAAQNPLFPTMPFHTESSKVLRLSLNSMFKKTMKGAHFNGLQPSDAFNPGRIRFADINTDGFPDIVVTGNFIADTDFPTEKSVSFSSTSILLNSELTGTTNRTFVPVTDDSSKES